LWRYWVAPDQRPDGLRPARKRRGRVAVRAALHRCGRFFHPASASHPSYVPCPCSGGRGGGGRVGGHGGGGAEAGPWGAGVAAGLPVARLGQGEGFGAGFGVGQGPARLECQQYNMAQGNTLGMLQSMACVAALCRSMPRRCAACRSDLLHCTLLRVHALLVKLSAQCRSTCHLPPPYCRSLRTGSGATTCSRLCSWPGPPSTE